MKSRACSYPQTETAQQQSEPTTRPQFMHVKHKIDSLLAKDISFLNKDVYLSTSYHQLQLQKHNDLLMEYVGNNYQEYNLPDPLPSRPIKLRHRRHFTTETQPTRKEIELVTQQKHGKHTQGSQYDPDAMYSHGLHLKTEPDLHEKSTGSTKIKTQNREARGYASGNPKKVIFLKRSREQRRATQGSSEVKNLKSRYLTSQFSEKEGSNIFQGVELHESQLLDLGSKRNRNRIQSNSMNINVNSEPKLVEDSYRFCIGCEETVLSVNIPQHEKSCLQFQLIASKEIDDLIPVLQAKINHHKIGLIAQLRSAQLGSRKQLIEFEKEGQPTALEAQKIDQLQASLQNQVRPSLDALQKLIKIKWFDRIRRRIQQIIEKQKHISKTT